MALENFIYESVEGILEGKFDETKDSIIKHKELYNDDAPICFSLLALCEFQKKNYNNYYQFMNDATFLVEQSKDILASILNELVLSYVNLGYLQVYLWIVQPKMSHHS